jgi:hypothetical protein
MAIIPKGSRYENTAFDFIQLEEKGDLVPVAFYQFPTIGLLTYSYHTYQEGERLDQLAVKYFKNPGLWWIITQVNPEVTDILNIAPGTKLRIPSV